MAERVSQVVAELLGAGVPITRVSQLASEILGTGVPATLVSQIVAEIIGSGVPSTRVSQVVAEILGAGAPHTRVSQVIVEVFIPNIEVFMPLVYPGFPGLGYSVHWKPKAFNMPTTTMETGARLDLGWSDTPLDDFELTYDFLRDQGFANGSTEFRKMMGFWRVLNGNLGRFLFPNPYDRSVTRQLIGVTDGTNHVFGPIVRTFGVEEYVCTEPVGYVDLTCPFNVYLGNTLQPQSSYVVDQTVPVNQLLDFTYTPAASQNIYVDMSYFYYCSFTEDTIDFEAFMYRLWAIKKVQFSSNRANT